MNVNVPFGFWVNPGGIGLAWDGGAKIIPMLPIKLRHKMYLRSLIIAIS